MEDKPATQVFVSDLKVIASAVTTLSRAINRLKSELLDEIDDIKDRLTALE